MKSMIHRLTWPILASSLILVIGSAWSFLAPRRAHKGVAGATSAGTAGEMRRNSLPQSLNVSRPEALHRGNREFQARVSKTFGRLPLSFEVNRGQTDPQAKFLARGRGYTLFLTANEAVLSLHEASAGGDQRASRRGWKFGTQEWILGLRDRRLMNFQPRIANLHSLIPRPESLIEVPASRTSFSPSSTLNPELEAPAVLRLKLVGANGTPRITGLGELPGKSNYFIGNDPKKWRTDVPTYARVKYENVYPGVDLVYYGNQGQLEYDFVVVPGAEPSAIKLHVQGATGSRVDGRGDLVVDVGGKEVRFHKPIVYQPVAALYERQDGMAVADRGHHESAADRHFLDGRYVLRADNQVGFEVAAYDRTKPLIIDPVLRYSTYLGGSDFDWAHAVTLDPARNLYVAGTTLSTDFPITAGAFQTKNAGGTCTNPDGTTRPCFDTFVAKLNRRGDALIYSTYLGGTGDDREFKGIAVDASGNAYVCGPTSSKDFPTTPGAFQTKYGGGADDIHVTKINRTGDALVYSTYLGGSDDEVFGESIVVDSTGAAYVNGMTISTDFPTTPGAFQTKLAGDFDLFVTKLNPAGSGLVYSTYLGGSNTDACAQGLAIDASGNTYVLGFLTLSTDFPTTPGAFQTKHAPGTCGTPPDTFPCPDATVTKLNASGSALVYSTYLGGSSFDIGDGLAIDSAGNAYIEGTTGSTDFPTTPGALQTTFGGGPEDVFATKLNADGTALVYSTYLGGSNDDFGNAKNAVDSNGNVLLTGGTNSTDFPTVKPFQPADAGDYDVFVAELNATGDALLYSTYLGGSSFDIGLPVALDPSGNAYVVGLTCSTDFLIANPFQPDPGGGCDAFVAKISPIDAPGIGLSRLSIDFGKQARRTTSPAQTVALRNVGSQPLVVSEVHVSAQFAQTNDCTAPLDPSASCEISVTFTPAAAAEIRGILQVVGNAIPRIGFVRLTGTGVGDPAAVTPNNMTQSGQVEANQKSGGLGGAQLLRLKERRIPWSFQQISPPASGGRH